MAERSGEARGRFITFEGGEGSGKSTQTERLAERLRASGLTVVATREPGGTEGADLIRRLLVEGPTDRWLPETEMLLHFAARSEHVTRVIEPALKHGDWIVCDRFTDSTVAYQGFGHGLGRDHIESIAQLVLGGFGPDLTIVLDIAPEEGLARAAARTEAKSRYERLDLAFHQRLRDGYLAIARGAAARCVVVAADQPVDTVAAAVWSAVAAKLPVPA